MKYKTILADPPWAYQIGKAAKLSGTADEQYSTSGVADICALGDWVQSVSDPSGCALLMWCTWPQMAEGLAVMAAWGFDYVTGFPWVKAQVTEEPPTIYAEARATFRPQRGVGFWTMGASEYVMVGRRGKVSIGRTGKLGLLCGSERQFWHPRGKHSRKPDDLHGYADDFLGGPRLELFARREREGWDCLGGDLGVWLTPAGPVKVVSDAVV